MTIQVSIEQRDEELVLETAAEVTIMRIPKILGKTFPALARHIEQTPVSAAGAPCVRYLNLDWNEIANQGALAQIWSLFTHKQKMLIGIPIGAPLDGSGEMVCGVRAAGRYLTAVHRGPYHKITATYKEMLAWAVDHDVALDDKATEYYTNDPAETPAADLETVIRIPLAGN